MHLFLLFLLRTLFAHSIRTGRVRVIESVEEMSKQSWLVCTVIINRIYACTCMFVRRMKKCNNMRQIVSYSFFFPILYLVWLNSGNEVTGLCSSPWAPALWRFVVNVGREGGTEMPEAWGVSGARHAFSLDVIAQPDRDEKRTRVALPNASRGRGGKFCE